ncbi:MAG: tyrosine-type recombinase/integrase [Lachnospiraceae bacterium]|nr:tyrosine-type recombinase/integrase [Lachnospiraceae bacterium]
MGEKSEFWSERFIQIFNEFLCTSNIASTSANRYWSYVKIICDQLCKDFLDIDQKDVTRYFDKLQQKVYTNEISLHTVCCRRSLFNKLAEYLVLYYPDYYTDNPFANIFIKDSKAYVKATSIPSLEELNRFLYACKRNFMHFLLYSMVLRMGIKSTELINLKKEHVIRDGDCCFIYIESREKYGSLSIIPMPSDIIRLYNEFEGLENPNREYLFTNSRNEKLSITTISRLTKKYLNMAAIDNHYTLKDFRNRAVLDVIESRDKKGLTYNEDVATYFSLKDKRMNILKDAHYLAINNPVEDSDLKIIAM